MGKGFELGKRGFIRRSRKVSGRHPVLSVDTCVIGAVHDMTNGNFIRTKEVHAHADHLCDWNSAIVRFISASSRL